MTATHDKYYGHGGQYLRDPATGERTRISAAATPTAPSAAPSAPPARDNTIEAEEAKPEEDDTHGLI